MNKFNLNFKEFQNIELQTLFDIISNNGKLLREVTLNDFIFENNNEIYPGKGCYFFILNNQIVYVGKCSSRTFISRIPGHLGTYENDWFNTLVKHKNLPNTPIIDSNMTLQQKSKICLNNFKLVLLNFDNDNTEKINKFENICRKNIASEYLINKAGKDRFKLTKKIINELF